MTAVFQCYLFQGKNYIDVVLSNIYIFSHSAFLGNFIHFEITFLKLFSSVCGQDGGLQSRNGNSLQNGGGSFLEIWKCECL